MTELESSAHSFALPGTAGDEIRKHRLSEYTEEGAVVLVFYPFDFSPVCTDVLCRFRDAEYLTFTENVDVVGISLDSCYAHKEFIDRYDIPFPLLSDSTGRVTEQFGLNYDEWEHHVGVPKRALVTIDESNEIRYKWHTEDAYESPNYDELHETVLSLEEEYC
ncbi:redoxin domain-containing protein [Halolamina salina]|uniref:Redoxin domain-containing protein n=1 Tax=Halolamina salina TaxID=1220023 RepID=A0ABD6B528_9EURY